MHGDLTLVFVHFVRNSQSFWMRQLLICVNLQNCCKKFIQCKWVCLLYIQYICRAVCKWENDWRSNVNDERNEGRASESKQTQTSKRSEKKRRKKQKRKKSVSDKKERLNRSVLSHLENQFIWHNKWNEDDSFIMLISCVCLRRYCMYLLVEWPTVTHLQSL